MDKKKLDLTFCEIYYDQADKSLRESVKFIKKAFEYNKKFFKISSIHKFKITLVYSRKEFDNLWGRKTQNWISAFAKKTKITIFSLEVYGKETCWKKRDFYSTLVHEINHIFFTYLTKKFYGPIWLSEGLATYLQHNERKPKKKKRISYKILNEAFNYKNPQYNMYHQFVYCLIKQYGDEKFIKFLRNYRTKEDINKSSKIIYNKKIKELIQDANKF